MTSTMTRAAAPRTHACAYAGTRTHARGAPRSSSSASAAVNLRRPNRAWARGRLEGGRCARGRRTTLTHLLVLGHVARRHVVGNARELALQLLHILCAPRVHVRVRGAAARARTAHSPRVAVAQVGPPRHRGLFQGNKVRRHDRVETLAARLAPACGRRCPSHNARARARGERVPRPPGSPSPSPSGDRSSMPRRAKRSTRRRSSSVCLRSARGASSSTAAGSAGLRASRVQQRSERQRRAEPCLGMSRHSLS